MYTFNELRKYSKNKPENNPGNPVKMVVMGDCATQLLTTSIKGFFFAKGINADILDIDYNQIETQIIDDNSETYEFQPDYILIYMCAEKMFEKFCETEESVRGSFAEDYCEQIKTNWTAIQEKCKCRILQFNFAEVHDGVFGNYASKVGISFIFQLRKLNYLLMEAVSEEKNVFLADISRIQNQLGRDMFFDEKYYYSAKTTISMQALPAVAESIFQIVSALQGKFKKCVILDLDNTLWGGVIGDDGLSGIQIGELGMGHAFTEFQLWLKELKKRGIILAVCSKNNEDIAKEPFEKHPEMVLRLEDISMFVANWEDKVHNILEIQKTLNIGMDSIVFLDDNPFERNMVREMIQEITVPELPEDPAQYLTFLKKENLFETGSYSNEDAKRTGQYQAEVGRKLLQKNYGSIDDYLKSLEMVAEYKPFDEFHFSRISQLTQRSNQFNLRTIRYTEAEIEAIAKDDKYLTLYYTLKDKFGDYGLISVVIMEKRPDHVLFIDTWLMSCRVLKRGMEHFIVDKIIEIAKENGYNKVIGEYIPTAKNAMVSDIYSKMGFSATGDNQYMADIETYKEHKTYIAVETVWQN